MRKIKISTWKAKDNQGIEHDDSIVKGLSVLLSMRDPKEMPKGLDQFRLYNRLSKAFDKADKTGNLELEEVDYKFLKDMLEKDVPAIWGTNPNIMEAVESFLNAKEG